MTNINLPLKKNTSQSTAPERANSGPKKKTPSLGYSNRKSSLNASSSLSRSGYSSRMTSATGQAKLRFFFPDSFESAPQSCVPTTRIVHGGDSKGCVVDAIAGASGKEYEQARKVAIEHGFNPGSGWTYGPARDVLSELGKNVIYHGSQPSNWEDFPTKALIGVRGRIGGPHAVILKGEYIYDGNKTSPVHRSNYELLDSSSYIEFK